MPLPPIAMLELADYARDRFCDKKIEPGVTIEDVLDRKFWVHRAKQLSENAIIELMTLDKTWRAELLVLDVIVTATDVHIPTFALLSYIDLTKAKKSTTQDGVYSMKFNGADKYIIIRNADKEKVEKGIPTREAAEARLAELQAA